MALNQITLAGLVGSFPLGSINYDAYSIQTLPNSICFIAKTAEPTSNPTKIPTSSPTNQPGKESGLSSRRELTGVAYAGKPEELKELKLRYADRKLSEEYEKGNYELVHYDDGDEDDDDDDD